MLPGHENLNGLKMSACLLIAFGFVRAIARWIRSARPTPEPWGQEAQQTMDPPEASEVCRHCSTPQEPSAWFCPYCGCAVGPYNNLMPYVSVFSQGEMLRAGVVDKMKPTPMIFIGYLLVSLSSYAIVAPVYWFFLLRNVLHGRGEPSAPPESQAV